MTEARESPFGGDDLPLFIDGIGPPLQQIEDDAREGLVLPGTEPRQAQDTVALIAEVVHTKVAAHIGCRCPMHDDIDDNPGRRHEERAGGEIGAVRMGVMSDVEISRARRPARQQAACDQGFQSREGGERLVAYTVCTIPQSCDCG